MMKRLYDISQTLKPKVPVWPGDTDYQFERNWVLDDQCPVNVGRMTLSTHTGTHADAPLHYDAGGDGMADVPLYPYIGICQVIDVTHAKETIKVDDFKAAFQIGVPRVLFRTYKQFPHDQWDDNFVAVAPETIDFLAAEDCDLIGLDSPSLDPQTSKTIAAHHRLNHHKMCVLEGLVLDDVPEGLYELIAPPLKIAGADAGLVRAVLREL